MRLVMGKETVRRKAFSNIMETLDFDRYLPDMIFPMSWRTFLFFQCDYMFAPEFAEVIGEFLRAENAHLSCLLNVDETRTFKFGKIAAMFLDETVTGHQYDADLRGDKPGVGWLYRVDRYACASDIGEWCIYCEKDNDVAVIGFRDENNVKKFESPLARLSAHPIMEIIEGGRFPVFPFNRLTPKWCVTLNKNYGGNSGG